jgi:EAL domain-containing protein (putative c-di-GMP-specific phosphodiesterase class I)
MASLTRDLEQTRRAREHFENLIANPELLGPDFRPIRRLSDHAVTGWQAVGRGFAASEIADRESFTRTAVALGLGERVDWTFRCRIFDVAAQHGTTEPLHLRPAFASYGTVPPPRLTVAFNRGRSLPVVAQVHDDAYADPRALKTGLDEFARWGWRTSVSDLSGRSDATSILQTVSPAYAFLDLAAPGRIGDDAVRRYVDTVARLGVEIIATGLDNPLRVNDAIALGATYGCGDAVGPLTDTPR